MVFNKPMLRVNNRDKNIAFYQETLGMKLLSEENAIVMLSAYDETNEKLILEESPSMRTRRVADGVKKVKQLTLRYHKASDIEALLARGVAYTKLYKGKNGYAFEALSPEKDAFLVHAEDDIANLVPIEEGTFQGQPDFKGVSNFEVEQVTLRVPDPSFQEFYTRLFDGELPLAMAFEFAEGKDLTVAPEETWDLEVLEFGCPNEYDLKALKAYFEGFGLAVYLDRSEKILVIKDKSQIELWFVK